MPELSVYSLTFTLGKGWAVVKSPCVSHLERGEGRGGVMGMC